ncbi:uncharacterized protein LOC122063347 [Macadamia integrifolia]|uniref:uncharacterized protein LOC122063347 n=1 Tax=Macadamia integrifolia TaxID=60698 RepID=UPI001C4FAAE0|nr:uncharacterized protein LOC122063347 [Macadamia integrifolia]
MDFGYDDDGIEDGMIQLVIGATYDDVNHFRVVLQQYVIQEAFDILKIKNEKTRVTAVCKAPGCTWRVHASAVDEDKGVKHSTTFMIKSYNPKHASYKVQPFYMKLYRARMLALEMNQGSPKDSYSYLLAYGRMVLAKMPGSLFKIQYQEMRDLSGNPIFKRVFVSFKACVSGFVKGCKPLIGVDGCHLKGRYRGILLSAVSYDGNNEIFPVTYVVVEVECKDSCLFFLECLYEALGMITDDMALTFMLDKQKMPSLEYSLIHTKDDVSDIYTRTSSQQVNQDSCLGSTSG